MSAELAVLTKLANKPNNGSVVQIEIDGDSDAVNMFSKVNMTSDGKLIAINSIIPSPSLDVTELNMGSSFTYGREIINLDNEHLLLVTKSATNTINIVVVKRNVALDTFYTVFTTGNINTSSGNAYNVSLHKHSDGSVLISFADRGSLSSGSATYLYKLTYDSASMTGFTFTLLTNLSAMTSGTAYGMYGFIHIGGNRYFAISKYSDNYMRGTAFDFDGNTISNTSGTINLYGVDGASLNNGFTPPIKISDTEVVFLTHSGDNLGYYILDVSGSPIIQKDAGSTYGTTIAVDSLYHNYTANTVVDEANGTITILSEISGNIGKIILSINAGRTALELTSAETINTDKYLTSSSFQTVYSTAQSRLIYDANTDKYYGVRNAGTVADALGVSRYGLMVFSYDINTDVVEDIANLGGTHLTNGSYVSFCIIGGELFIYSDYIDTDLDNVATSGFIRVGDIGTTKEIYEIDSLTLESGNAGDTIRVLVQNSVSATVSAGTLVGDYIASNNNLLIKRS